MAHVNFDQPVFLKLHDGGAYEARGPRDAVDYLEHRWPAARTVHYRRAKVLCYAAVDEVLAPETARVAVVDAATRVGILLDKPDLEKLEPLAPDNVRWADQISAAERELEVTDTDLAGYSRASDIVDDPSLSPSRKRALLAYWASDMHAVTGSPALRRVRTVTTTIDSILEAMCVLDAEVDQAAMVGSSEVAGRAW